MSINKRGLRKQKDFNELLGIIKENQAVIKLPDRWATILRDSQKYQNLISDDLSAVHDHQEKIAKPQLLQQTLKSSKQR